MQRMEENREKISKFVDQKRRRGGKRAHKNATKVKKMRLWESRVLSTLCENDLICYVLLPIPVVPQRGSRRLFYVDITENNVGE